MGTVIILGLKQQSKTDAAARQLFYKLPLLPGQLILYPHKGSMRPREVTCLFGIEWILQPLYLNTHIIVNFRIFSDYERITFKKLLWYICMMEFYSFKIVVGNSTWKMTANSFLVSHKRIIFKRTISVCQTRFIWVKEKQSPAMATGGTPREERPEKMGEVLSSMPSPLTGGTNESPKGQKRKNKSHSQWAVVSNTLFRTNRTSERCEWWLPAGTQRWELV